MSLSRDDILKASDGAAVKVSVPEWGGDVFVKPLTAAERDWFEESLVKRGDNGEFTRNVVHSRARLVFLCVVDETGKRLFTEADVPLLTQKSVRAVDRVLAVANKLNAIGDAEAASAEKNSEPAPEND